MPDEILRRQVIHPIHPRKRQRPTHIPTTTLPQRTVPTLDMSRLAAGLTHRVMPSRLEHSGIDSPKITVGRTPAIARRNAFVEPTTRRFTAITEHLGDYLRRSSAQRHAQPALVCFRADETAELVKLKTIR